MPTVGTRPQPMVAGKGYMQDPMARFASAFNKVTKDILNETGFDVFQEGAKVLNNRASDEAMRTFFVEQSADGLIGLHSVSAAGKSGQGKGGEFLRTVVL